MHYYINSLRLTSVDFLWFSGLTCSKVNFLVNGLMSNKVNFLIIYDHVWELHIFCCWMVCCVGGTDISCTFSSHTGWVSCVAWSPSHSHHFVSGSYDQLVKLWDTRWYVLDVVFLKHKFYTLCLHARCTHTTVLRLYRFCPVQPGIRKTFSSNSSI